MMLGIGGLSAVPDAPTMPDLLHPGCAGWHTDFSSLAMGPTVSLLARVRGHENPPARGEPGDGRE